METPSDEGAYSTVALSLECCCRKGTSPALVQFNTGSPVCVAVLHHTPWSLPPTPWWTPANPEAQEQLPVFPSSMHQLRFLLWAAGYCPGMPGDFTLPARLLKRQCTLVWIPCALFKKNLTNRNIWMTTLAARWQVYMILTLAALWSPSRCSQRPWKVVTNTSS